MSNELGGITNKTIRDTVGSRSFGKAGLAIHGSNVENILTAAAVPHCINGVFQTELAIDAELDLSAAVVIDARDGSVLAAVETMPEIAAGADAVTKVYILACKGDVSYIVEPTLDVAAAGDDADYPLSCPSGFAPYGAIKVVQSTTSAAGSVLFTLGTTDMSGVTNQTVTFFDLSVCPATVAQLATV